MIIKYRVNPKDKQLEEASLLGYGSLYYLKTIEKHAHGIEYIHFECIGTYLYDEKKNEVILYSVVDFGPEVRCEYIIKDVSDVYYLSGYLKSKVIDEIRIYRIDDKAADKRFDSAFIING